MKKYFKSGFSSAAPARKLFSNVKQVRAARREKFLDFFMQNRSKLLYLVAKICTQGSNRGGALPPHQNLWGGIRPPCPPASYAYGDKYKKCEERHQHLVKNALKSPKCPRALRREPILRLKTVLQHAPRSKIRFLNILSFV